MKSLRNYQGWGIRALVVMLAVAWLALVAANWSEASESTDSLPGAQRAPSGEPSSAPRSDDEYNFNWLDPEKKIYVLQNRRYLKEKRLLLSAMVGPGFSNPYRTSYNIDPRLAYYFSETWGFEVFYTFTMNSENGVYEALKRAAPTTLPVIREIKSQAGAMLHWVPWYAKINVFNKILYFDWYFGAGGGQITADREPSGTAERYVQETYFAGFLATGHQYHLSNNVTVRLDFTGAFYQAPVFTSGEEKAWFPNYNFGIGVAYRF